VCASSSDPLIDAVIKPTEGGEQKTYISVTRPGTSNSGANREEMAKSMRAFGTAMHQLSNKPPHSDDAPDTTAPTPSGTGPHSKRLAISTASENPRDTSGPDHLGHEGHVTTKRKYFYKAPTVHPDRLKKISLFA